MYKNFKNLNRLVDNLFSEVLELYKRIESLENKIISLEHKGEEIW